MAKYPIKMLLDEGRNPFFPLVTVDTVLVNGSDKTVADLFAERYTKTEVDNIIASLGTLQRLCGKVNSVDELPTDARPGDTYIVIGASGNNAEYMYIGDAWEQLGPMSEMSGFYTSDEVNALLQAQQDAILSSVEAKDTEILKQAKQYTDSNIALIPNSYYNKEEIDVMVGQASIALTAIIEGGE